MTPTSWIAIMDSLLEAVWLVDAVSLRIVAVNKAACDLVDMEPIDLVGRPAVELTATPEDMYFWEDVAAGLVNSIQSETLMRGADGQAIPVERKVSRVWPEASQPLYVVGLRDLRQQRRTEDELEKMVAELRATLESAGDGILVIDQDGSIRNYNRHFAELWSVPESLLIQRNDQAMDDHMRDTVADSSQYADRLSLISASPLLEASDVVALRSGRLLERITLPQFSRGRPTGRVFSFHDITQRTDTESRLRLAAKVFESSLDAIFITDSDFRILAANPVCSRLTGLAKDKLLEGTSRDLFFDPHDLGIFRRVEYHLLNDGFWEGEVWRKHDSQAPVAVQVSWVLLRDEKDAFVQSICFFRDLTEKRAAQQRIETLAYTDVLTGLPNRLLLAQRVDFALRIAERKGGNFAVFFLDLDRFKNINDSMGHAFGDRVLVEVCERTKLCLRDIDTLSRLGGDEFAVFLQDADIHGAEVVAKRILESLARPFEISGMSLSVGCSMGIALYPGDGLTLDDLIKCADTAMYRVKERGRGNFRFYQPQMNVDQLSRVKLDHAMRIAMADKQFQLHYQPQISLGTGQLLGAEALIRWTDAELGTVSPSVFISLAEETGFIIPIGNWVLGEAVRQAALWQHEGMPVCVSINVSALQFQQADFVELVAEVLGTSGLDPYLLELELTESILVRDAHEALERLHALAALGVALSIDDFGTGYSSLAYLKRFPISKLKIDRSFVMGLPHDEGDKAIVSATIGMARALKLKVVAEGVETAAQRDYLNEQNCESFQGFLCAPALPVAEFEQLMGKLPKADPTAS